MAAAGFYSEELIYLVLLCLTSSISYIFICKITFSVKSYQIWLKSVVKLSIKIVITLAYVVILKIKNTNYSISWQLKMQHEYYEM